MEQFIQVLLELTAKMGYLGVFLMMTLESTFLPIPSELIVPPAIYLAYHGQMNAAVIMVVAVIGSTAGALINYFLARYLGRPLIYAIAKKDWMKYLFITHPRLEKAESFFIEHGNISTFIGRLVIGIRHLISIPAGFSKMPLKSFILYTVLGSFIWVCVLASAGYVLALNETFFRHYFWYIAWAVITAIVVVVATVYFLKRRKKS
jgi:membrane protein DedA with SNARE-associated domain